MAALLTSFKPNLVILDPVSSAGHRVELAYSDLAKYFLFKFVRYEVRHKKRPTQMLLFFLTEVTTLLSPKQTSLDKLKLSLRLSDTQQLRPIGGLSFVLPYALTF